MGNARFGYYRGGFLLGPQNESIITVSMGQPGTVVTEENQQIADVRVSYAGFRVQNNRRTRQLVHVSFEGISDMSVVRALYAMENHLLRGGYVLFSADNQSLCFGTSALPSQGATTITGLYYPFSWTGPDVSISDGEELVIETLNSTTQAYREYTTANGNQTVSSSIVITPGCVWDYAADPTISAIIVRNRYFWPAVRLAGMDQTRSGLVTPTTRNLLYRFDATFEYTPYVVA